MAPRSEPPSFLRSRGSQLTRATALCGTLRLEVFVVHGIGSMGPRQSNPWHPICKENLSNICSPKGRFMPAADFQTNQRMRTKGTLLPLLLLVSLLAGLDSQTASAQSGPLVLE